MPSLAELRSRLPHIRDLEDGDALTFIQRAYYPGRTVEELGSVLGVKPPAPPVPRRNLGAVANDTVIEVANAAAGGLGSAAEFVAPGNALSRGVDEFVRSGEASQSDAVRAEKQRFGQEVEQAEGIGGELAAVGGYVARNPLIAAAQAAGSFVGPGMAIRGAQGAARAVGAGAQAIGRAGLAGGALAGAALAGGDAAGQAYELAKQAGASEEEAVAAARQASVIPAVVGGAGGLVGAERVFAGAGGFAGSALSRAAKTGLVEGAQEAVEEGVTNYEGRRAAQPFDASIDPMKGTAAAAGMGFALGGATGAGIGALSPAAEVQKAEATQRLAQAGTVSDMIAAATDLAGAPLDISAPVPRQAPEPFERFSFATEDGAAEYAQRLGVDWAPTQKSDGTWSFVQQDPASTAATGAEQPFADRISTLRQQLEDPAMREQVRSKLGDQALETLFYYAQAATRRDVPAKTTERMLGLAEMVLNRAVVQPIAEPAGLSSGEFGSDAIGMAPAAPQIGLDTSLTGAIRVDSAGTAAPETQADRINTNQAQQQIDEDAAAAEAEREILGQQARKASAVNAEPNPRRPAPPVNMPERRRTDAVEIAPPDPVAAYISDIRRTNTPAARAFIQDLNAGRITRQDIVRVMQTQSADPLGNIKQAEAVDPVQQRIERAAAQAPTRATGIEPARMYRSRSAAFVQARKTGGTVQPADGGFVVATGESNVQPDLAVPAAIPAGSGDAAAPDAGRSVGDLGPQPGGDRGGVGSPAAAPVVSGRAADAARNGDQRNPALKDANETAAEAQGTEAPAPAGADAATQAGVPAARGAGDVQAVGLSRRAKAGKARTSLIGDGDTMLQALAKAGGLNRVEVAREFGLKPEELKATVKTGNLRAYPFRNAGLSVDRAIETLQQYGYFDGVADEDVRNTFEAAIFDELGGNGRLSTRGQEARPGRDDEGLTLEAQTAEDLRKKTAGEQRAAAADAAEQKRLADKAKADAQRDEFTLTGSDSAADVAAAAGQGGLFDEPAQRSNAARTLIEDAGEKIGGARKDRWKDRGLNLDDLDAMSESEGAELATKANVWKPDYAAMAERTDPVTAAMVKTIYDQLAAKPKENTPAGRRAYVEMMQAVRRVYTDASNPDEVKNGYVKVRDEIGLSASDPQRKSSARAMLFSVYKGRSDPFVMGYNELARAKKMVEDGFPGDVEPWKRRFTIREHRGTGITPRGVELGVEWSEKYGTPMTAEQIKAGYFAVLTKGDNIKTLAMMPTRAAAEAKAKELYDRTKGKGSDKIEPDRPHLDNLTREGLAKAVDRNVTSEDMLRDFGFRGIEFGNWAAQDERQRIMNMAHDALSDLATILNLPRQALSLNGTIGMAFGARGTGRALAHYEAGKLVINMTKLRGAGSLAHEWAHSFDHYLGELDRSDSYQTEARGASGWRSQRNYSGKPQQRMVMENGKWVNREVLPMENLRPELARAVDKVMQLLYEGRIDKPTMLDTLRKQLERTREYAAAETDPSTKAMYERGIKSQQANIDEVVNDPADQTYPRGKSNYSTEAQKLSGKALDGYWLRPTEMFARAFESYVFDRLGSMGAKSEYLVHGVEANRYAGENYKGNPYPVGGEREAINKAFDALTAELKTRQTDKGTAIFSRTGEARTKRTDDTPGRRSVGLPRAVADQFASAYEAAGLQRVNVARNIDELPSDLRKKLSGFGDDVRGAYFPREDEIWVFSDKLNSPDELAFVALHEAFHRGLGHIFGDNSKRLLRQMYATNKKLRDRADKVARDLKIDKDTAIEEALADMAGEGQAQSLRGWSKLANMIRNWLNKITARAGLTMRFTDAQVESFVSAVARAGISTDPDGRARADGFDPDGVRVFRDADMPADMPMASRAASMMGGFNQQDIRNTIFDRLSKAGEKVSWWDKTLGTQYAKAQKHAEFKPVFEAVQSYIKDTSTLANEAADMAPSILPKLESIRDVFAAAKRGLSTEDAKALSAPIFEGTLNFGRQGGKLVDFDTLAAEAESMTTEQKERRLLADRLVTEAELKRWKATPLDIYDGAVRNRYEREYLQPGVVFNRQELRERFKLTEPQIEQYEEFRAAVNESLDQVVAADVLRVLGDVPADLKRQAMDDRSALRGAVEQFLNDKAAAEADPDVRAEITATWNDIADKYDKVDRLKARGYAPLMRFGKFLVSVKGADGEQEFFGLYETRAEANKMARELGADPEFAGRVKQGVISQEAYKLFSGVPVDSLEMFADALGTEKSAVFQEWLRLTKNNRSALKRLIKRKGTAGFSDDVSRVLASFVTSNARMAAGSMNMPQAKEASEGIASGDLKDEAIKLVEAVQNPSETAGAIRGLMFVHFIGGSIASALVNTTQPLMMTLPYLSQWGGATKAAGRLMASARMAAGGNIADKEMAAALKRGEQDGIVSPQEIHHLTAEAMASFGKQPALKRLAFLWSAPFSLAEQFNRRITFLAAYQTAKAEGMRDPFEFAKQAITETQGLYNKGNAPNLTRNAIGATALTFKQYSIHYLEWLGRMWNAGEPGSKERTDGRRAVLLAMGLLLAAGGTEGLPFAEDMNDLFDTFMQSAGFDTSARGWKRDFLANTLGLGDMTADVAQRGLSALPGIPLDVSLRMGMGNLLPGTGMLLKSNTDVSRDVLELAGPVGGMINQYKDAGRKALDGDLAGAALGSLPVAMQNIGKAATMWQSGEFRDTKGRRVMETDEVDGLMKLLGFQPAAVARESAVLSREMRRVQLVRNVETQVADLWAQGVRERDPEMVAEARQQLQEWNETNPKSRIEINSTQIKRRVKDMQADRADRFERTAPKEIRGSVAEALQ